MRVATLLLFLCALAGLAAEPSQKVFPLAYDQRDLPNGLRLITVPTDYPNVVALYIVVQTGSRNEVEPGKSGFAHFFEHMMFRGTKSYPPEKYEAIKRDAGAAANAYTSDDLTVFHMAFSKEDLEQLLMVEADRFQNLEYPEAAFRTEALAVLGEYNKNSASPTSKLSEVLRDTAFDRHTYKHTTMGFLKDIVDMPNQYDYSRRFFDRYYRPEYVTIIVAGDVKADRVRALVEKYWGNWKRGGYRADIPPEPPQTAPREGHVDWPTPTLPWVAVAFKAPAYSDQEKDSAALDLISLLGFSSTSELYQKLVIREQKVDVLSGGYPDHVDPYLFTVLARIKNPADMASVKEQILSTLASFQAKPAPAERLDTLKRHARYSFALRLNNSEAIAATLARYVALTRTPETVNRRYELYGQVTPQDIQRAARRYFEPASRTIVTLTGASPAAGRAQ
jgi:zinc protease